MAARKDEGKSRPRRAGTVYCCVYGCHNSYRNTAGKLPKIKFYGFPWRPYETERRERWIRAVRRASPDGGLWQPVKNQTRICSAHFVGNERSSVAQHPAYIPTIFPECYGKGDGVIPATKLERYQRLERRGSAAAGKPPVHTETPGEASPQEEFILGGTEERVAGDEEHIAFASVTTQTEGSQTSGPCSLFLSVSSGGSASTQVCHSNMTHTAVQATPATTTTSTGLEERSCVFLGYNSLIDRTDAFRELCGVSSNVFALLTFVLSPIHVRRVDIPVSQKLVIFLMKLKLGISFASLGALFGLHRTGVSRIFFSVLSNLLTAMKECIPEPSLSAVQASMPACFKLHYPRCRYIIDCTEIRTEEPPTVEQKRALFSHYKGCYTLKFLIGILPNGVVTFLSDAYGGRTSDTRITLESGFLDRIEPGDIVLADKGFPGIKAPTEGQKGILVLPPFSKGNVQFTHEELLETYNVAQVRIHVERVIQRVKMFNVLNTRIPVDLIPRMGDIMRMCCILANLQAPIFSEQSVTVKSHIRAPKQCLLGTICYHK
ncbi:uncharacterized protein LOC119392748 [Rhipicephalus sanguineus]|uniref:uncharacterized protein LOC119392748 n=1 Tax=Rhipicephalus sanguineus TaxID=34632 RepID=UPI00189407DF|nr:uncharacterized protein LOC119392748 [Rhipicephalus sanguineus]